MVAEFEDQGIRCERKVRGQVEPRWELSFFRVPGAVLWGLGARGRETPLGMRMAGTSSIA